VFVRRVWAEAERRHGVSVHPLLRRFVDPDDYLTDHGDEEEDRDMFREAVDRFILEDLPGVWREFRDFAGAFLSSNGVQHTSLEAATPESPGRRFYPKCLQRHLRIVGFVAEHALPPPGVLRGDFSAPRTGIPWKKLWPEWNRTFVYDQMSTRESLRVAYARAVGRPRVREAYLRDLAREMLPVVWPESLGMRSVIAQLIASGAAHQIRIKSDRRLLRGDETTLADVWDATWPERQRLSGRSDAATRRNEAKKDRSG